MNNCKVKELKIRKMSTSRENLELSWIVVKSSVSCDSEILFVDSGSRSVSAFSLSGFWSRSHLAKRVRNG